MKYKKIGDNWPAKKRPQHRPSQHILNTFAHPQLRYKYHAAHALIEAGA